MPIFRLKYAISVFLNIEVTVYFYEKHVHNTYQLKTVLVSVMTVNINPNPICFFFNITQHCIRILKLSFNIVEVIPQLKFSISNVWPKTIFTSTF